MKTAELRINRLIAIFSFMVVVSFCSWGLSEPPPQRIFPNLSMLTSNHQLSPQVSIQQQEGAPLIISIAKIDSTNLNNLRIEFFIENVSHQAIRAYAIKYETKIGSSTTGGLSLNNFHDPQKIFYPRERRADSVDGLPASAIPLKSIVLAVDYVEFMDDSSWGEDIHQSAEFLQGQRTGAEFESRHLLALLDAQGLTAVLTSIRSEKAPMSPHKQRTAQWQKGVENGRDSIRAKLKHRLEKGEAFDLRAELQKPYDASKHLQHRLEISAPESLPRAA